MKSLLCLVTALALLAAEAQAQTVSRLYGVTGDGGDPAETLFILDKSDASSTFVMTLGNGSDGEEIAFNPDDGLLYHASGRSGVGDGTILETIDPGTLVITDIPLSGYPLREVFGFTYEGAGVFLASHRGDGVTTSEDFSSVTTAGVGTNIGEPDARFTGLAYVGSTLYAVARNDDLLRTIDPSTGATLSSVTITLSGETISGANGLATDPVDDTLWALLKTEPPFPVDPRERTLVTIDPATGVATSVGVTDVVGMAGIAFVAGEAFTVTPSVGTGMGSISPSDPVEVISGLTTSFTLTPDPGYVIDSVGGTCGGTLDGDTFTTDPVTADCTVIANFAPEPTTVLYGVTGDGGVPPETLFRLDLSDASTTHVLTLGAGTDGEEIAFNRDDGLMYHMSGHRTGGGVQVFESIDLDTLTVTPIATSGANYNEVTGMAYAGQDVFHLGERSSGLSEITTAGVVSSIGNTDSIPTGLAYIGTTLYAVARDDNLLRIIDPATGSTLGSVTMTMAGFTLNGATGLTTNPDDHTLWAILKIDAAQPAGRALATVDPVTGDATYIGTIDVIGMAGIDFAFIPCDPCDVTPSVGGGSGTISPSTVQSVAFNSTTDFTLTPDTGYHIDFVGGTCGGTLSGDVFTIAPVFAHCDVIAFFAINVYNLTYTAGANGSISGDTNQMVEHGSDGTEVTAVPDVGYDFAGWSDGVMTASRTDTNVTSDISVTANFTIKTYTVNSSVGTGLGSISPLGDQQVDHGSTAQFTLTPATGYHIDSVGGTCGGSLDGSTFTTNAITADCTVVANFAINVYDLTYTAGANGSILGDTNQMVEHGSDGTEVTAVPDANYHFTMWSDGVLMASRTDTNVTSDISVTASFAIDTYTVTSSVGSGQGTIAPLGGQVVEHGSMVQYTLTPDTGYHIDSVGGTCGGSLDGNTFTTNVITADCTVIANFAINVYDLTYMPGPNGSISGDTNQMVEHGSDGTEVTAVPDANYHFVDWSDGVMTASRTDTNVTADISATASFAIDTYTVTSSVGTGQGTIAPLGEQEVDHGQTTQFTVTPDTGYSLDSVGGTCGGSLAGDTYTTNAVTADCTVVANFVINTYTVTSSVGTGQGTINPLGDQQIDHGQTTQFTLTPDTGYQIDSVGGTCGGALDGDTFTTSAVTDDCTVIANFAIITYTVTSSVGTGQGTIAPLGEQEIDHGQTTQFTVTPDTGYSIDSVGGTCGGSLDGNTFTTNAITADCTVIANFVINTYTVTSSVGTGQGTIAPLGEQQVDHGQTTQFTLTPDAGYHIDSVGGTCGGALDGDTYTTVAITDDCTVIANFAINVYDLTYTASVGGSISGDANQMVEHGADGTEVTAVPDSGYSFVDWSDGEMSPSRTDTNVTADISVTANFVADSHTVTSSVGAGSGTIDPLGAQDIDHGETTQFTLTPDSGFIIDSVGGTCGGSLVGSTYTTNPITADCTVVANFVDAGDLIISTGFE